MTIDVKDMDRIRKMVLDDGNVQDPDKGHEEYDIWLQSPCGRSSVTKTVKASEVNKTHDLGVWTGKMCLYGCIKFHMCRVGSTEIKKQDSPPIILPIMPGQRVGATGGSIEQE
jgi:hypothetical protein